MTIMWNSKMLPFSILPCYFMWITIMVSQGYIYKIISTKESNLATNENTNWLSSF